MNKRVIIVLTLMLTCMVMVGAGSAIASKRVNGNLVAKVECAAYASKNKKTNPDRTYLNVGESYTIFEVNRPNEPGWVRIRIGSANPEARWVSVHCGDVTLDKVGGGGNNPDDPILPPNAGCPIKNCNQPDQEDSFVLALSWQPAFCETHRNKPECAVDDPEAWQATHFTLHGLWPNKKSCGIKYGYCGSVCRAPRGGGPTWMCNYPPLSLSENTKNALAVVMPSVTYKSCLDRHEWYKHGTCATPWSADEFYTVAVELTQQFNNAGSSAFMADNLGKSVASADFRQKVDQGLGEGASNKMTLNCDSKGRLVDVMLTLPANLTKEMTLANLLKNVPQPRKNGNCGNQFKIDVIGQ